MTEATKVTALKGEVVQQVACGSNHSAVLTTGGKVYTWGFGEMFQLGHGRSCGARLRTHAVWCPWACFLPSPLGGAPRAVAPVATQPMPD